MLAVVDECRIKVGFLPTCSRRGGAQCPLTHILTAFEKLHQLARLGRL